MKSSHAPKHWDPVIAKINEILSDLKFKFGIAFSEGVENPVEGKYTKELIRRNIFNEIWERLEKVSHRKFGDLKDLDQQYNIVSNDLNKTVAEYLSSRAVKRACEQYKLEEPVTEVHVKMLKSIISFHHLSIRYRYLAEELNDHYSADQCMDLVEFMKLETSINREHLYVIDIDYYNKHIVNPFIKLNANLIEIMFAKGYGKIVIENLLTPSTEVGSDDIFLPLLAALNELPSIQAMVDVLSGTADPDQQILNLKDQSVKIEEVRKALRAYIDTLLDASDSEITSFQDHCRSLRQISEKLKSDKSIELFFMLLMTLKEMYEQGKYFNLVQTMMDQCQELTPSEMLPLSMFRTQHWKNTEIALASHVSSLSHLLVAKVGEYNNAFNIYQDARQIVKKNELPIQETDALIKRWCNANAQTEAIVNIAVNLLGEIAVTVKSLSRTTLEKLRDHVKRHIPEYVAGPLVGGGVGAAISYTALAAMVFAGPVLIPVGIVVGGVAGGGISLLRDRISPPKRSAPAPLGIMARAGNVLGVNAVLERLFGTADDPVINKDLPINSDPAEGAASPATNANSNNDPQPSRAMSLLGWFPGMPSMPSLSNIPVISAIPSALPSLPPFFRRAEAKPTSDVELEETKNNNNVL